MQKLWEKNHPLHKNKFFFSRRRLRERKKKEKERLWFDKVSNNTEASDAVEEWMADKCIFIGSIMSSLFLYNKKIL